MRSARVLVVASFVVTCLVGAVADPVSAAVPSWASDGAEWINDQCVAVPQEFMGAASGTVATWGLTSQGSGYGPSSPTTIPNPRVNPTVHERVNPQTSQLWGWLNAPPADLPVPATPPATGTVNAQVGSDAYMRQLLGSDWYDDWVVRNNVNTDYRISPAQMNDAFAEKGLNYRYPTLPQSTVGGSGAAVIDTTGTVKAGTDQTKAAVSPARLTGTGLAAMSGSTVALSALTFGGAMCGTLSGLKAVFGDPWEEYDGPTAVIEATSTLAPCPAGTPGAAATDRCVSAVVPSGATRLRLADITQNKTTGVLNASQTLGSSAHSYTQRLPDGSTTETYKGAGAAGSTQTLVVPCATPENLCGLGTHNHLINPTLNYWGSAMVFYSGGTSFIGGAFVAPSMQDRGKLRRLFAQVSCKDPDTMVTTVKSAFSSAFWDDQATPNWPGAACDPGTAPVSVQLRRQTMRGGAETAATWSSTNTALDWELPTNVRNNATTLRCFVVGAASCQKVDVSPTEDAWGGLDGERTPKDPPMSDDVVDEVIDSIDLPDDPPELGDDAPAPGDEDGPGSDPDPDPGGDPDEDPDFGVGSDPALAESENCLEEGWTWNPISWVLTPIKCAFEWAFVPPADELSDRLDDLGDRMDDPPFGWGRDGVDMLSGSSLLFEEWRYSENVPCFTAMGSEFCGTTLDPGPVLPTWMRAAIFVGLWILLAVAVVRWL